MAESFLHLIATEQSQILRGLAPRLSRSPTVLEKDVWVCWVLQTLFAIPGRLPMVFKGGTSLSKVFKAIARFSEDVDITLDYRSLDGSLNPFSEGISNTRLKKFSEALKGFVRHYVHTIVVPHFREKLVAEFGTGGHRIEVSEDGEQLRVHYSTVPGTPGDYVGNSVLVEFGGRNITEPNEEHQIRPDIAEYALTLLFPDAQINVLSPERTFWEKATLMHVECQRKEFRTSGERLSRHWYDMAMLAELPAGQNALADRDLLADVIRHKKIFYNASYASYDACLTGQLRLLPDKAALLSLKLDYQRMIGAGMFIGEPPAFEDITDRLHTLETRINR